MTMQTVDMERAIMELQAQVRQLTAQLDAMRTGVAGRQMLERGALVVRLGSVRTDTARTGETNYYVSGATVIKQVFDGTAWRAVTLT